MVNISEENQIKIAETFIVIVVIIISFVIETILTNLVKGDILYLLLKFGVSQTNANNIIFFWFADPVGVIIKYMGLTVTSVLIIGAFTYQKNERKIKKYEKKVFQKVER